MPDNMSYAELKSLAEMRATIMRHQKEELGEYHRTIMRQEEQINKLSAENAVLADLLMRVQKVIRNAGPVVDHPGVPDGG